MKDVAAYIEKSNSRLATILDELSPEHHRVVKAAMKSLISAAELAKIHESTEWNDDFEIVPKNGKPFLIRTIMTFRWVPYVVKNPRNPKKQNNNGVTGRWQFLSGDGFWKNCDQPIGDWKDYL